MNLLLKNRATNEISKTRILVTVLLLVLCGTLGSIVAKQFYQAVSGREAYDEKDFTSNGMTITLTTAFRENDYISQTASYTSKDVIVLVKKETFSELAKYGEFSLEEYAEGFLLANHKNPKDLQNYNGIPYYEYDAVEESTKQETHYRWFIYKSDDAFWVFQFVTLQKYQGEYEEMIKTWASSVRFQ